MSRLIVVRLYKLVTNILLRDIQDLRRSFNSDLVLSYNCVNAFFYVPTLREEILCIELLYTTTQIVAYQLATVLNSSTHSVYVHRSCYSGPGI